MMRHVWTNYEERAFGKDELRLETRLAAVFFSIIDVYLLLYVASISPYI